MLLLLEIGVKFSLYLTTLTAIGLSIHAAIGLPQHRRLLLILVLSIPVLKAVHLLLLNAQLSGDLASIFDFSMFDWIWPLHQASVTALAIGCLLQVISLLTNRAIIGLIGGLAIAISFGLGGHTQGLEGASLAPVLVAGHAAIAGFWFAAPITLHPRQSISIDHLSDYTIRFSAIAIWLVPLMILMGMVVLWLLTGSFEQMFSETYGQLLLGKVMIASTALAIGAINKDYVASRIKSAPASGRKLLVLSLRAEAGLFLVIIACLTMATTVTGPIG